MSRDPEPEVHEVFATIAADRSREERNAWVAFAANYERKSGGWFATPADNAQWADAMLEAYRKRFSTGGAE